MRLCGGSVAFCRSSVKLWLLVYLWHLLAVVPRSVRMLCAFPVYPWQRFRLAWRHIWPAMGFYFALWVLLRLWRFSPVWGLWCFAAFAVSPYAAGLLLGIICPSFFRVPFWDPLRLLLLSWFNNTRRRASFPVSVLRVGCMALQISPRRLWILCGLSLCCQV